jgi:uncharacterized phage protein gp47/JayE
MQLQLQTFTTLLQNMAAAVQGASRQLVDLTVGSALRAVLEANASLGLWVQWLILQVLQTTRASTSTGTDLDSWMADFSLTRLPPVAATGVVSFARFTSGVSAFIAEGVLVQTSDGTQSFSVQADATNAAWSAAQSGYTLAAAGSSIDLPVTAAAAGSAGNVQPGAITQLAAAIPGIDTVTNAAAMQGGVDAETDPALRTRFQNFLDSRARATPGAIGYAVSSLQQGLQYLVVENVDTAGAALMGNFVVTIDDGSGNPPASLLASAAQAVEAVRPIGSSYAIQPPAVTLVNVALTIQTTPATRKQSLLGPVEAAVIAYINALPIGAVLPLSRIAQVAYGVDPTISNVSLVSLDNAANDIAPAAAGVVKAGTVVVN